MDLTMATRKECNRTAKPESTRKGSKPIVEKKRRARINHSVEELKVMVFTNVKHKRRIEKADILEKAVVTMRRLASNSGISSENPQREGFMHCLTEAIQFLTLSKIMDDEVIEKVRSHLLSRLDASDDSLPSPRSFATGTPTDDSQGDADSDEETIAEEPRDFSVAKRRRHSHSPARNVVRVVQPVAFHGPSPVSAPNNIFTVKVHDATYRQPHFGHVQHTLQYAAQFSPDATLHRPTVGPVVHVPVSSHLGCQLPYPNVGLVRYDHLNGFPNAADHSNSPTGFCYQIPPPSTRAIPSSSPTYELEPVRPANGQLRGGSESSPRRLWMPYSLNE